MLLYVLQPEFMLALHSFVEKTVCSTDITNCLDVYATCLPQTIDVKSITFDLLPMLVCYDVHLQKCLAASSLQVGTRFCMRM